MSRHTIYRFDDYVLNRFERTLERLGFQIEIPSKTFDLLLFLVENSGEAVSKDRLLKVVWRGMFVEESNLTVQIAKLRKLLKTSKHQKLIKTVQGVGYQFVVPVQVVKNGQSCMDELETGLAQDIDENSIAILPFSNENGDEKFEYLADGLTESLINSLSYASNFRVIARDTVFRYKNSSSGICELGTKLGVKTLVNGRLRIVENNLIVGVELVKTSDGSQIWGTQITKPFSNIFDIQEYLTLRISEQIKAKFRGLIEKSIPNRVTQNTESYRFYLKGEYFSHKRSLESVNRAIKCFQKSISHDPLNSLSYIGLARCYVWTFLGDFATYREIAPIVDTLLKKATEISPANPDLYVIKGRVAMNFFQDFVGAEVFFKKAIDINSNHSEAYYPYSYLLAVLGRFSEALEQLDEVSKIDPFASQNGTRIARTLYYMGKYEGAILKSKEAIEADPTDFIPYWIVGVSLCELEKYEQALEYLRKSLEINCYLETLATIGYVHARRGEIESAETIINQLDEKSIDQYVPEMYYAMIYCALGKTSKTLDCLEKAFQARDSDVLALEINPRFASLRTEPRFQNLLNRVGLKLD